MLFIGREKRRLETGQAERFKVEAAGRAMNGMAMMSPVLALTLVYIGSGTCSSRPPKPNFERSCSVYMNLASTPLITQNPPSVFLADIQPCPAPLHRIWCFSTISKEFVWVPKYGFWDGMFIIHPDCLRHTPHLLMLLPKSPPCPRVINHLTLTPSWHSVWMNT